MKKIGLILLFLSALLPAHAQNSTVKLQLKPLFNAEEIVPGKSVFDPHTKDSLRIDAFRFYVSGICFYNDDSLAGKADGFYLVDLDKPATLQINCPLFKPIQYNKIKFNIGVDSLTNVSGVFGGALDPANGMYWAWQSGYINFKLEGYSPLCKTRNHKFQFHLGGYMSPYASLQTVELACPAGSSALNLELNLNAFLNPVDLATENQIMSPGARSVVLSGHIPSMFRLIR